MHPDRLFLRRCKQIAELATSHDEGDLLDAAAIIRQLLFDQHSLAERTTSKKRLRFHVGRFSSPLRPDDIIYSLEDGIDPQTRRPGMPSVRLDKPEFGKHVVMYLDRHPHTIKSLIRYAANVAGGVHYDPAPDEEYKHLHRAAEHFRIGGLPMSIRSLQAIARVTLRGLAPLIADVEKRQA